MILHQIFFLRKLNKDIYKTWEEVVIVEWGVILTDVYKDPDFFLNFSFPFYLNASYLYENPSCATKINSQYVHVF